MPITLRHYQEDCIQKIKDSYAKGKRNLLVSLPTGSGKTVIFGSLINRFGVKTLVLTHTEELLFQTARKMKLFNKDKKIGLLYAKDKDYDSDILVATVQSASTNKSLEILSTKGFKLIVADECHHSAADTWRKVLNRINPDLLVGFTATAFRSDKKGLAEIYDEITFEKSIVSMINSQFLCPIISKQIRSDLDFTDIENEANKHKHILDDFPEDKLDQKMNCPELIENIIDKFTEEASDRKTIAFCTSVNHAQNLASAFIDKGFKAQFIYGGMKTEERQRILSDFKDDKIQVLTNCQILTEGFDEPSVNSIIIAKPTKSAGAFQQMIGRGLRLYPNKTDCLVMDFTDINRTVQSVSKLLHDKTGTISDYFDEQNTRERENQILSDLPPKLNKNLKTFLVKINLFPNDFQWNKEKSGNMTLKGVKYDVNIIKQEDGFFLVKTTNKEIKNDILECNLDFEMAYGIAEAYVKKNLSNFILVNRNAPWRQQLISPKQKSLLEKNRFKAGISELTKGQAADIINEYIFKN